MSAVLADDFEVVEDAETFFAPVSSDLVDTLVGQYRAVRNEIEMLADAVSHYSPSTLHYFAEAAGLQDRHLSASTVATMFAVKHAVAALNAAYWSKAMQLTDVLDVMPQKRRDEWHESIRKHETPDFTDENVRSTLQSLLAQRERFFAERVDGIFRSLSGDHVTNIPEGFGKRMILAHVVSDWGTVNHGRAGVINDLRCVIARFMGRDEPKWDASSAVVRYARERRGEWISIDGGAIRIRCYMVGTAHLEIHPDMAWRLNCVLAQLHPLAIPAQFRQKPKKKAKEFQMIGRPLPFAVLSALGSLEQARDRNPNSTWRENLFVKVPGCYDLKVSASKVEGVYDEAGKVLIAIGGTRINRHRYAFDYNPLEVVKEIVASGCIPDQKAHQFYPTPESLARIAVEFAEIGEQHACLEPSAGTGGLADLMPKDRTRCVEVSPLHCTVLESKGHTVEQADFIAWAESCESAFDRIVMNPPFSEGRWKAHTESALRLLSPGGVLVAILPASAKNSYQPEGVDHDYSRVYENEFAGTSVSVVMLKARKAKPAA